MTQVHRVYDSIPLIKSATSAAPGIATATISVGANEVAIIDSLHWSSRAAPSPAAELLSSGLKGDEFTVHVVASGPDMTAFVGGLYGVKGANVVFTLASGGGTAVGKLNVSYRLAAETS